MEFFLSMKFTEVATFVTGKKRRKIPENSISSVCAIVSILVSVGLRHVGQLRGHVSVLGQDKCYVQY